jgi:small basic protein (TIGR04137 family)
MTMDKSLKSRLGLVRSRSVLTRAERIERLSSSERWKEGESPFGLPKVRVRKITLKKKKKKKEEEGEAGAEGAEATEEKKE